MDPETKNCILQQVPIVDEIEIERVFHEEKQDIVKTIMRLNSLTAVVQSTQPTIFDDIRKILDDKDCIFNSKIESSKAT